MTVFVCPRNGELTRCRTCEGTTRHRHEQLRPGWCQEHAARLVEVRR